jgi:hypothetical protein
MKTNSIQQQKEFAKNAKDVHEQQNEMAKNATDAHDEQMRCLTGLDREVRSNAQAAAAIPSELEKFHERFRVIEGHLIEVKAMVDMQENIPQRVMALRLTFIIDPFEANSLTIPLDTFDTFEAVLAVFEVRFKDMGEAALGRVRQRLFVMYDQPNQKQIDMSVPWLRAFKVRTHV